MTHPGALLSNVTSMLPHNTTALAAILPPAAKASNTSLQLQMQKVAVELWRQTESVMQYLSWDTDAHYVQQVNASQAPVALRVWLREVVSRSVMWPVPRWPLYLFMAGAMICLAASAFCHLLACCSRHVGLRIWRLDYAGVQLTFHE